MSEQAKARARGMGEHIRSFRSELADQTQRTERRLPACCHRPSFTYFIEGAGMIKIGVSSNPVARLSAIQVCCPVKLSLVALTRGNIEEQIHARCHGHRSHGEWFNADGVFAITRQLRSRARDFRVCLACALELNLPDFEAVDNRDTPEVAAGIFNSFAVV